jgi:phenylacetate-coenzyme A ligase PaaK-like adenylate-forming protein
MDLSKDSLKIFNTTEGNFDSRALEIFQLQYANNIVYQDYVNALGLDPKQVRSIFQIPFLPIRFFKSHIIKTTQFEPALVFESSGTTGSVNSRHFVKDASIYEESFIRAFGIFYGNIEEYCVIGLLPSYLERENSSLVYMVNELIKKSCRPSSGFYLHEHDKLFALLSSLEKARQKTILIGVTFALLDFAEAYPLSLQNTIVMETGGMKGRRREMIRQEVHDILQAAFGVGTIHSEYGMTELLSQAYSKGNGIFHCPPWMKIVLRDDEDPLFVQKPPSTAVATSVRQSGVINIIDLANIHSCCFIATDDAGRLHSDGSFEVIGRIDNSDLRGCSLLTV